MQLENSETEKILSLLQNTQNFRTARDFILFSVSNSVTTRPWHTAICRCEQTETNLITNPNSSYQCLQLNSSTVGFGLHTR